MAAKMAGQNHVAPETRSAMPTRLDLTLVLELGIFAAIVLGLFGDELAALVTGVR